MAKRSTERGDRSIAGRPDSRANAGPPKLTAKRQAVLRAVRASCDHPTASDVFQRARTEMPAISFATVYNALRYLTDAGLVAEVNFGKGASCYDREVGRHDHAVCSCCGSLVDFNLPEAVSLMPKAARQSHYKPQSVHLTLVGLCPKCAKVPV